MEDLFRALECLHDHKGDGIAGSTPLLCPNQSHNASVYCSYMQIYNDKLYDLLSEQGRDIALTIREAPMNGLSVKGLTEIRASSVEDVLHLLARGKTVGHTQR